MNFKALCAGTISTKTMLRAYINALLRLSVRSDKADVPKNCGYGFNRFLLLRCNLEAVESEEEVPTTFVEQLSFS